MKHLTAIVALSVAACLPVVASAADAPDALIKKYACVACHAPAMKLVGPSYKDVAAKYAGQKDAEAKLAAKVKAGGSGVWGAVPMPPNPAVPDADLKAIIAWILATK